METESSFTRISIHTKSEHVLEFTETGVMASMVCACGGLVKWMLRGSILPSNSFLSREEEVILLEALDF